MSLDYRATVTLRSIKPCPGCLPAGVDINHGSEEIMTVKSPGVL